MSHKDKLTDEEIAMFEGATTEIKITNKAREEDKNKSVRYCNNSSCDFRGSTAYNDDYFYCPHCGEKYTNE